MRVGLWSGHGRRRRAEIRRTARRPMTSWVPHLPLPFRDDREFATTDRPLQLWSGPSPLLQDKMLFNLRLPVRSHLKHGYVMASLLPNQFVIDEPERCRTACKYQTISRVWLPEMCRLVKVDWVGKLSACQQSIQGGGYGSRKRIQPPDECEIC